MIAKTCKLLSDTISSFRVHNTFSWISKAYMTLQLEHKIHLKGMCRIDVQVI